MEFEFSGGFYENFINECFEKNKDIKNIALCDGGFIAECNIKTYKTLHRAALRHGGKIHIIKKRGLPFLLKELKNRTGFFAGIAAFVFIISFLEGFVWNVEITGAERLSETLLISYLDSGGLKSGAMWSVVDRDKLSWNMMSDFDDIAWVHINKIGTTARVEINETAQTPAKSDDNRLKGGTVLRKELEAVAYRQQSKISVKSQKQYKRLLFFSADIPLYLKLNKGDIEEETLKMLTVKEKELPIGISVKTEKYLKSTSYDLTDNELLTLAKKKLSYLEQQELDEYEIINRSLKYDIDNDKCIITGAYIVRYKE